jgi:Arc/MetJ family transcription regulator
MRSWRYDEKVKKRATIYVDEDVLRAAKVRAAREGRHDYEVVEAALRQYLGFEVIDHIRRRNPDATEATVMAEAIAAVHEVRTERAAHPPLG